MILNHCRLIPALSNGMETPSGAVILEGGKIADVRTAPIQNAEAEVFDCKGMTLLPGLIDAHTHIIGLRGYTPDVMNNPVRLFMRAAALGREYLQYGFTTIRDCGTPARIANYVRDAFSDGLIEGPEVISPGLILSPTEIEEDDTIYRMYQWADGADAMRRCARKELAEHADFIKIMASGSAFHRQGIPVQPIITESELRAVVETASLKGSYVAAHAHGDGAIRLCAQCGVRTIEHASYIGEETIGLISSGLECYLIPTLSAMYQNPETTPPEQRFLIEKLEKMLEISSKCISKAYQAGLMLGFGTDSTVGMDQYDSGIEFRFRRECCGMQPVDILLQATRNNAEILGIADRKGAVSAGMDADLILVKGMPDRDISAMYHKPEHVFLRGRQVR